MKEEQKDNSTKNIAMEAITALVAYQLELESENTALKLEVETGQGIVLKLLKECEDRKLEVERLKEALKKILSHADPYDQEGNVFISIAEQVLTREDEPSKWDDPGCA